MIKTCVQILSGMLFNFGNNTIRVMKSSKAKTCCIFMGIIHSLFKQVQALVRQRDTLIRGLYSFELLLHFVFHRRKPYIAL